MGLVAFRNSDTLDSSGTTDVLARSALNPYIEQVEYCDLNDENCWASLLPSTDVNVTSIPQPG